jgi:hypothetical protein
MKEAFVAAIYKPLAAVAQDISRASIYVAGPATTLLVQTETRLEIR